MLAVSLLIAAAHFAPPSPIAFPHPLITEVLYNVPQGSDGDANGDGSRSANGDEFIELVNPHDKPIDLEGYTITDGVETQLNTTKKGGEKDAAAPADKSVKKSKTVQKPQVEFTFPKLVLQPGEKVLVFNGCKQKFAGPHGTTKQAPAAADPTFGGAYVFTMAVESTFVAMNNASDAVQLLAPAHAKGAERKTVEVVWWGKPGEAAYDHSAGLCEEVKEGKGSVHRIGRSKNWASSGDLSGNLKGLFSPGAIDLDAVPEAAKDTKPAKKDVAKPKESKTTPDEKLKESPAVEPAAPK